METKIYTMQDWSRDGELSVTIGQEISNEVYWELLDAVPPAWNGRNLFQVGEAYDHDKETLKPLYTTFERNEKGNWVFKGHCLLGKTENRRGWAS